MEEELLEAKGCFPTENIRISEDMNRLKMFVQCLQNRDFTLMSSIVVDVDGFTEKVIDTTKYDTKKLK